MIATAAVCRSGLFSRDDLRSVPLTGVQITARLVGFASSVTVRQHYRNLETVPVEAVYTFPLPESAALCGLVIETDGRRISGAVRERESAFDEYDEALAAGHGAVLVDAERPNVFVASVGNLLPGQEMTVELTWVAELAWEGEALRFTLPTTVSPRYAPPGDRTGVGIPHGNAVNPPILPAAPYGFSFEASIEVPGGVSAVASPSHPMKIRLQGDRAVASLIRDEVPMDRDLVLLVEPTRPREPWVAVESQADGTLVAAISLVPVDQSFEQRAPREVVFVVDCSGSMAGSSIASVRRALHLCLRSLAPGDRFQLVRFGSTFEALFPESVPYAEASLERAAAEVDRMEAEMGGTEILRPLRWVLDRPPSGLPRDIILLTDGQVSNEDEVIALARAHAATTRMFTFGIGYGCSEYLVRALARTTRGAAEMVHPEEPVEPTVLRQFARLGREPVQAGRLSWAGLHVLRQVPRDLGPLAAGEPLLVFTWVQGNGDGVPPLARHWGDVDGSVELSLETPAGPHSWRCPVRLGTAADGVVLGTLAARAAIRELEDADPEVYRRGGSRRHARRTSRIQKDIAALAVPYGLVSSATSLVAVEHRSDAGPDEPIAVRPVPVALTHGWGGVSVPAPSQPLFMLDLCSEPEYPVLRRHAYESFSSMEGKCSDPSDFPSEERAGAVAFWDLEEPSSRLTALIRLQRADGAWELSEELAALLEVELSSLVNLADRFAPAQEGRSVVATLAALRCLEIRFAARRDEWAVLAEKARRWLSAAMKPVDAGVRAALADGVAALLDRP